MTRLSPPFLRLSIAVPLLLAAAPAAVALELGFEGRALAQASDNIRQDNAGLEEEGSYGVASLGVFGEQLGTFASGGFRGEIDARKRLDDTEDDIDTITSFLGAVEFQLTPRVFSWYVGDVLGSIRADAAGQQSTDFETRRRNVFVTGPQIAWDIDSANRIDARLLYLNQSEDGEQLESLYNGFAEFRRERISGQRFGARISDIYVDASRIDAEEDLNRLSASVFAERERGFWTVNGELGATRYTTEEETIDGALVQLGVIRQIGPVSRIGLSVGQELSDQTLSTVTGLLADGSASRQDADGIFQRTYAELLYSLKSTLGALDLGAGAAQLAYQTIDAAPGVTADAQDQFETYVFGNLSRSLGTRWNVQAGARYEQEVFDNAPDESDSFLGTLGASYRLSRSFELEANYLFNFLEGIESGNDGAVLGVDRTENRVGLGLRWAPPTRASQELTIELKSLVQ